MAVIKSSVLFVHRWLGVCLSLLFVVWFASGIGMMYWPYPTITPADRLEHAAPIDPAAVRVGVAEAATAAGTAPVQVRLSTYDGRPVYRLGGRAQAVVYADTGEVRQSVDEATRGRVAAAWAGRPLADAKVETLADVDQWTIQVFRAAAPLRKYSWPSGEHVYVSERTGEVVQATTTGSRIGAYLGPIPHWLYFTPLRKNGPAWSSTVIWLSAVGTFTALIGLVLGVWFYSPARRYRIAGVATSIPYRGWKRWHMVFGLVFGIATVTWTFSGLLSMEPFPPPGGDARESAPAAAVAAAFTGSVPIEAYGDEHPRAVLGRLARLDVRELEWTSFAGQPIYLATMAGGETRVLGRIGPAEVGVGSDRVEDLVRRAAGPAAIAEIGEIGQYDRYYLDRNRRRPLPVVLAILNDAASQRFYIDPKTGRIVGAYSNSDRFTRWAYHALHSFDFPWLYNHRPAWDLVVIGFMLGGVALSATSVLLGWRVLTRKLSSRGARNLDG